MGLWLGCELVALNAVKKDMLLLVNLNGCICLAKWIEVVNNNYLIPQNGIGSIP